jgi:hypothetical protein
VICSLFLFLAILEKRIPTDAVLAVQHLHSVRFALHEPLVDTFDLYLGQVSGLLGRQHLAVKPAHATVRGRRVPHDALLLENRDLDSSSLYCGHLSTVVRFAISLPASIFERGEITLSPSRKSGRK